jgi:hypothetical protein
VRPRRFYNSAPRFRPRPKPLPYRGRDILLSPGELAFYRALCRGVAGSYLIAFKVRAADLLTCSDTAWKAGFGFMVARHHLDFVLCDARSTRILAAIELDDRSHDSPKRKQRDEFLDQAFAAARLPLIRFRAAAVYSPQAIACKIKSAVGY